MQKQGIEKITLIVASSIGADLGLIFLSKMKIPIEHTFLMEVNLHRFQDENHMQMQILDPKGFAKMLDSIIRTGKLMRIVSEH